jgi:hypothetical protein
MVIDLDHFEKAVYVLFGTYAYSPTFSSTHTPINQHEEAARRHHRSRDARPRGESEEP